MKNATKTTKTAKAIAPKADPKPAKAAAAPKAAKTTKAAAPKAAKPEGLAIHINPSGRVCFGKAAAERIGELAYMAISENGKGLRLVATAKETETPIRRASGRPYITATKELKAAGLFDGAAVDLIAQPFNGHGFDLTA